MIFLVDFPTFLEISGREMNVLNQKKFYYTENDMEFSLYYRDEIWSFKCVVNKEDWTRTNKIGTEEDEAAVQRFRDMHLEGKAIKVLKVQKDVEITAV